MELDMEETMIRIAFEGMHDSLTQCVKTLDLSTIKEVFVQIEFQNGQYKKARTDGKDLVQAIHKYQALLKRQYPKRKEPRLTIVAWIRYLFTGKP